MTKVRRNGQAPIRVVKVKGDMVAAVRAKSEAAAIRHATKSDWSAPIATAEELIEVGQRGFTIEDAGEEQPQATLPV